MTDEHVPLNIHPADMPIHCAMSIQCPKGQTRLEFITWAIEHAMTKDTPTAKMDDVAPLLAVTTVCGHEFTYPTAADLPIVDVPCLCGRDGCWAVKWEEAE